MPIIYIAPNRRPKATDTVSSRALHIMITEVNCLKHTINQKLKCSAAVPLQVIQFSAHHNTLNTYSNIHSQVAENTFKC